MIQGVDVAQYQGGIDWNTVKASTQFAIIKATGGCPDPGQSDDKYLDSFFHRNRDEARRVGMLRGFYHYAYPEYNTPEAEAEYFARVMGDLQEGELVVLDYESSWTGGAVDFCSRWLKKVEELLGVKPLIYLNLALTKAHDWSEVIANGNGLWLAEWTYRADGQYDTSQPWPFAAMMQYSNKGNTAGNPSVNGIPATVDLDVFMGDAESFKKYGKQEAQTTTTTTTTEAPQETTTTTTTEEVTSTTTSTTVEPQPSTTTSTTIMDTTTSTTTVAPAPAPVIVTGVGTLTEEQWLKTGKALLYAFVSGFIGGLFLTYTNYLQSGQPTDTKFFHSLAIGALTGGINGGLVFLKQLFSAN